jgi:predicted RNase H-like HicB family nuclease
MTTPSHITISPRRLGFAVIVREDVATDGTSIYVAEIPELPGCMSHGDSSQEAMQNVLEAAELYLEARGEDPGRQPKAVQTSGTGFFGGVAREPRGSVDAELANVVVQEKVA